ncbi:MAG TPA: efflux RND transporter periplasmic adaptor subunit [Candidatus Acidoferrum sp.]|nr:efflux RND transporter periplasmic adaptor subunit [Candidatus Acidoferrum sp.]
MTPVFRLLRARRKTALVAASVLVLGAAFFIVRKVRSAPSLPTASVVRKEFVDYVEVHGEIKALHSVTIVAPSGVGDMLILKIAPTGTKVKKGDTLVEFDTSTLGQKLAQDRSALKSAEAAIEQSVAGAKLKEEQDLTDVMSSRFDLQSARMDASKQEILSEIDGKKALLKVADAEQKVKENEAKLQADRSSAKSDLASKVTLRERAGYQVKQDERGIEALTLRAPIDGSFTVLTHWEPTGTVPFKPGDRVWPGAGLAELPDNSTLRVAARVEEADRGRMRINQPVTIRLDAIPDRNLQGKVDEISPTASMDFSAGWPFPRNFSLGVSLTDSDNRLASGMSATARVAVDHVDDAVVIPVGAVFRKSGRSVVYVLHGSRFVETPIEVARRNSEEAMIAQGIVVGDRVALREPPETD